MSWSDWLIIIVFTLTHLLTVRRFSVSSPGSATEGQEVETLQDLVVRLASENRQMGQRHERMETDYNAALTRVNELSARLDRRTHALEACRRLLAEKQGIEDSGEIDV